MMNVIQKQHIARHFSRASVEYDDHAHLQEAVREKLYLQFEELHEPSELWLDAGSGPGQMARDYPQQEAVLSLDLAVGMSRLAVSHGPAMAADMEKLPLSAASVAGIFSSLAVQWLPASTPFWREAYRITRPGGKLLCATLTRGTLQEMAHAYEAIERPSPLLPFLAAERVNDSVRKAGWQGLECKTERRFTHHASVFELLKYVKKLGASASAAATPSIRHRGDLMALETHYPANARAKNGPIVASWQVLYICAQKPR